MLGKVAIAVAGLGAALTGLAGPAWAEPDPDQPPPPPNINGWPLAKPSDFAVNDGVYAFAAPNGVTCIISRGTGGYGCSGALPGAPNAANVVTGGPAGEPGFANAARPIYNFDGPVKPLPPGTRLSFRTISCGIDGAGATICTNSFDQTGFILGPVTSSTFGAVNPLLDRPKGTNPYFN